MADDFKVGKTLVKNIDGGRTGGVAGKLDALTGSPGASGDMTSSGRNKTDFGPKVETKVDVDQKIKDAMVAAKQSKQKQATQTGDEVKDKVDNDPSTGEKSKKNDKQVGKDGGPKKNPDHDPGPKYPKEPTEGPDGEPRKKPSDPGTAPKVPGTNGPTDASRRELNEIRATAQRLTGSAFRARAALQAGQPAEAVDIAERTIDQARRALRELAELRRQYASDGFTEYEFQRLFYPLEASLKKSLASAEQFLLEVPRRNPSFTTLQG